MLEGSLIRWPKKEAELSSNHLLRFRRSRTECQTYRCRRWGQSNKNAPALTGAFPFSVVLNLAVRSRVHCASRVNAHAWAHGRADGDLLYEDALRARRLRLGDRIHEGFHV